MGQYDDTLHNQQDALRDLVKDVAKRRVVARSKDGLVTATAIATGQIVGLELDPQIFRNPDSKGLAAKILQTMNRAIEAAANKHLESLEQISGTKSGSFNELFTSANQLADRLAEEADRLRRKS
ncbi:MAG: YbaB/EbfC family nucleoid-associated protein [Actinomadura sp.]